MAVHRSSQLWAALTLLTIVTWLGWSFHRSDNGQTPALATQSNQESNTPADTGVKVEEPVKQSPLLDSLCHYGVCDISPDAAISYGRIDLVTTEIASFQAPLLQNLSISLPTFDLLNREHVLDSSQPTGQQAVVKIGSKPSPADASNIIFGVATNVDRLEDSLDQFSHWASGNGARIIALLPNISHAEDIERTQAKSKKLKVDLTILTNEMAFDDRYFHLATLISNYSTPSTEWASFIDDDTFFPSMNTLQSLLAKHPSPKTNPYYVGSLSEDFHQLFKWGYMAYGGGGVFVSTALLTELLPHLPTCAAPHITGDSRLAQCIFSHTTTKLSPAVGLFQIDLWGDASGFYEALRPQPVSVHHWKSWHRFDMVNISRVSVVCGDACIFQKYRLADDYQLTNGFSIVKYSEGNERLADDARMEKTWLDSQGGTWDMFLHSVAPLRTRDDKKIQYLLEGSVLENGAVRQFYVRRTSEDNKPTVRVLEVAWRKGPKQIV